MLLALDVGNTHTVVGVFDEAHHRVDGARTDGDIPGLLHHWRVATLRDRTPDELALIVRGLTALAELEMPMFGHRAEVASSSPVIDGLAISSSVPTQTAALREMAARYFDAPCVIVEPGIKTGMPILYDNPREVGADRISNAVAALDLYDPPAIVVDLGTATTFDCISAAGEYLGGAIVPGIEISMDALFDRAEALRRVELREPRHVVGRTTVEAMQSGAIYGYAALVDGLCRRIEAEIGTATIVATGGLSSLISPHAEKVAHVEPWLTLHGLRLIYLRNVDGGGAA
jgi:type III pantothenate kinase